jgi:hypothetical protein
MTSSQRLIEQINIAIKNFLGTFPPPGGYGECALAGAINEEPPYPREAYGGADERPSNLITPTFDALLLEEEA